MRLVALAAIAILLASPAHAQTPEERVRLDWVQQRGRLLYEIDRAAWVTTDDLRERMPDIAGGGIRGWIVEREGTVYNVTFYAGEGDSRVTAYRARVENNRVVAAELVPPASRPELTPLQRRLANARDAVPRMNQRPCTPASFNTAVIPPDSAAAPIDVYALTSQTDARVFPFGGHFLATVSPTGAITAQRAFMRSCFNAPLPPGGTRPASLFLTHLLDQTPTEIHVFLSIWMGFPVFVGTTDPPRVWSVTGDRIELTQIPLPAPRN